MKYIKQFSSHTDYEEWVEEHGLTYPNVSQCVEEDDVHYNPIPYKNSYLTFIALEDTQYKFTNNSLQYSVDDGSTWTTLAADTNTPTIHAGERVMWKQTGLTPTSSSGIGTFVSTGEYKVQGNVMSLYYGDNFVGEEDLTGKDYAFRRLFQDSTNLISASHLALPATTLSSNCYRNMFNRCYGLIFAPLLPATALTSYCYGIMFQACYSLVNPPKLPATILADACYTSMFSKCKNLKSAPELPATTLANNCYENMFQECISIETPPRLPATNLASGCYGGMFFHCSGLTTAPELPATTLVNNCYEDMFFNCTSLATAPTTLPATTLAPACYQQMFENCTSLLEAPILPATELVTDCYKYMFLGASNLHHITAMFLTTPSSTYMGSWVSGVASDGTFVGNCNAEWNPDNYRGVNGIPNGWDLDCDSPGDSGGAIK